MGGCVNKEIKSSGTHIDTDKYKTIEELNAAMRSAGIESMQFVFGLDFSASNGNLHDVNYVNPYMRVI